MKKGDIIYGVHPILEAVESSKTVEKVLIQKGMQLESVQKLMPVLREASIPYQYVPKVKLDSLTRKNHQGIVAFISPIEYTNLEWLLPSIYEKGEMPLLVILDHITDVRNFGAVCRSAECAGAHAVIIPSRGAAQVNEDAVKTSAGALLRIPVCRVESLTDTTAFLRNSGVLTVACHEKGEKPYFETDLKVPLAVITGSEDTGISPAVLEAADSSIHIPMTGGTSSLNVSVATAIILFDAARQRRG